jgi:tRNA-dihydrouridine synthase B
VSKIRKGASSLKIGNKELKYGLFLAPMAGFTDRAMRLVAKKHGAEFSTTEMVSAKAVCFEDKKTHALARIKEDEGPVSLQIFGSEPDIMAKAAQILQNGEADGVSPIAIDINMGCPVNKIYSNGEGSALMRNPDLIYKITKAVSENINIPTTVKLRAGVDESSKNAVECALAAEAGGASVVTVHGRTRVEMYSGTVDAEIIKNVKKTLQIPVIANGDVNSYGDYVKLLSQTGADGVMIGRGAIGNPFIFEEIIALSEGIEYRRPSLDERAEAALYQLSAAVADKGEAVAVRESRKQIALYLHSFRGAAELRRRINSAESYEDVQSALYAALSEAKIQGG